MERNFHIFYAMLAGATDDEKTRLKLGDPKAFHYLNQSGCVSDQTIDDKKDFERVCVIMSCKFHMYMQSAHYCWKVRTVEPPNKGHVWDNISSLMLSLSFVERLSSSRRYKESKYLELQAVSLVERSSIHCDSHYDLGQSLIGSFTVQSGWFKEIGFPPLLPVCPTYIVCRYTYLFDDLYLFNVHACCSDNVMLNVCSLGCVLLMHPIVCTCIELETWRMVKATQNG